jgi:hypothetical protein
MLTKKNYEEIARIIRVNLPEYKFIEDLIRYFKRDNPNFDEINFKKACGLI